MLLFSDVWKTEAIAATIKRNALSGFFDGLNSEINRRYLNYCTGYHSTSGAMIIFTRDIGAHTGGWWKNPDYERCLHLSLSFQDPFTSQPKPRDKKATAEWIGLFFGDSKNLAWCEPPFSNEGKAMDTWHYRVFCDPAWGPIMPRKEVYSKEFTEKGWKSWSEINTWG